MAHVEGTPTGPSHQNHPTYRGDLTSQSERGPCARLWGEHCPHCTLPELLHPGAGRSKWSCFSAQESQEGVYPPHLTCQAPRGSSLDQRETPLSLAGLAADPFSRGGPHSFSKTHSPDTQRWHAGERALLHTPPGQSCHHQTPDQHTSPWPGHWEGSPDEF